jgi:hypothetical protein
MRGDGIRNRLHLSSREIEMLNNSRSLAAGAAHCTMTVLLVLLFAFTCTAGWAEGQAGAPPSAKEPLQIRINTYPVGGKVSIYSKRQNGKLLQTGSTGSVIEIPRDSDVITIIVENKGFFRYWRFESPEIEINEGTMPICIEQKLPSYVHWERIILIVLVIIGSASGVIIYHHMQKKRDEMRDRMKAMEDAQITLVDGVPEKIAGYTVLSKLGQGGMASVFKVKDRHGDIYALKVPHLHIFTIPEFRARFLREAEIIRELHHPNIVRMYDYSLGEDSTTPYICLEFVTGISLKAYMDDNPSLPLKKVLSIIIDVASALGYAHSKGIVHRDVKPENIMMTDRRQIKLMDLGIARAAESKTLTATGTTLGTPYYLAPEQVESKNVDGRADLYSLGVIFFELLTNRLPFDSSEAINIIVMHVSEEPPSPRSFNALIPDGVERCVLKLLAKRPSDRYQTAEELVSYLSKLQLSAG